MTKVYGPYRVINRTPLPNCRSPLYRFPNTPKRMKRKPVKVSPMKPRIGVPMTLNKSLSWSVKVVLSPKPSGTPKTSVLEGSWVKLLKIRRRYTIRGSYVTTSRGWEWFQWRCVLSDYSRFIDMTVNYDQSIYFLMYLSPSLSIPVNGDPLKNLNKMDS